MKKILIIFLCLLFGSKIAEAQHHRDNFSFGIGPSILYGENAGLYSKFRVKALPSFTFSYSYDYAQHWDIRASAGIQRFDGAGIKGAPKKKWIDSNQAYDTKGQAYFIDVMPVYQFNPIKRGKRKHLVSYYAGLGVGIMNVQREAKIAVSTGRENVNNWATVTMDQSTTAIYFPVRVGVSTNLMKNWDFGIEGSALTAASYNLDGNNFKNKLIKPDMLVQLQVMVKRNLNIW